MPWLGFGKLGLFVEPRIGIGLRFMRGVAALFALAIHFGVGAAAFVVIVLAVHAILAHQAQASIIVPSTLKFPSEGSPAQSASMRT